MKMWKKLLSLAMTIALVCSLFSGAPLAFAEDTALTVSVTDNGSTATLELKLNQACLVSTLDIRVAAPTGFTYKSHVQPGGFSELSVPGEGHFIFDTSTAVTIAAGATILSVTYNIPADLPAGSYDFSISIDEAADGDLNPIQGLDRTAYTATLVRAQGEQPPAAPTVEFLATDMGETVMVELVLNLDCNISVLDLVITPPEGFEYNSHTNPLGFDQTNNTSRSHFIFDNTDDNGIAVSSGDTVITVNYSLPLSGLYDCEYEFTIRIDEASDPNFEPIEGVDGETASAAFVRHDWGEPTYEWSDDNSQVTAIRYCTRHSSHYETETVNTTSAVTKPATCEAKGETTYTATFTNEAFATQTKVVEDIPALGHSWGAPTYEWNDDNSKVTATRVCARDASHVETETVDTVGSVTRPATCETKGETTYTATFTNEAFETQTKVVEDIPALGHDWGAPTYVWSADNSQVTATRVCRRDSSHVETETVSTTSAVTKPATCEDKGETTYTATFTNEAFETQTKVVANIDALGHAWGERTYVWKEAGEGYQVTASVFCANDDSHSVIETVTASYEVITEPTMGVDGLGRYTAHFDSELFEDQTKDVVIPKLGHKVTVTDKTKGAATCSLVSDELYYGVVEFTVSSVDDKAVLVAVKNGDDYTAVKCTTDADGVHHFSIDVQEPMDIFLALKGDVNLDGVIRASDGTMVKRSILGTYDLISNLAALVADTSGDGILRASDGTMIARSLLGTYTIKW